MPSHDHAGANPNDSVADVIVVGAGSAGSVLAARLSENVTGVRDSGTRIRVLWERPRGCEGYSTIHESSALRKILAAAAK